LLGPGISFSHPLVSKARSQSLDLIGDVELFVRENTAPIIAVTGSNAKSTVVTLLSLMAQEDNKKVSLAGNIGRPLLDSWNEDDSELYVLELSSFQLDITDNLKATVSSILNISPDHLDRYENYAAYANSKQKIYINSESIVWNRDDQLTFPKGSTYKNILSFGLDSPKESDFGLNTQDGVTYLACGKENIVDCSSLAKQGVTDLQNALAAMAIARSAGISYLAIIEVLKNFKGLEHRCELVANFRNVKWVNDSKGTNVGACDAAISSLTHSSNERTIILIAGGDSKGSDLNLLRKNIKQHVKSLLLIGKDAQIFKKHFEKLVPCEVYSSLEETVQRASELSEAGDTVLLSPACSSLDMFKNYQDRGDQFKKLVLSLAEEKV